MADITTFTNGVESAVYNWAGSTILSKIFAKKKTVQQVQDVATNPTTVVDNADDVQPVTPQVPLFGTPEREKWRAQDQLRNEPIFGSQF